MPTPRRHPPFILCPLSHYVTLGVILVAKGAGLAQLVHIVTYVHKYVASQARHPLLSCVPVPSCPLGVILGADGAGLEQLVHIVCMPISIATKCTAPWQLNASKLQFLCFWFSYGGLTKRKRIMTNKANTQGTSHVQLPCALLPLLQGSDDFTIN